MYMMFSCRVAYWVNSIDGAQLGGGAGAAWLWSKVDLDLELLRGDNLLI